MGALSRSSLLLWSAARSRVELSKQPINCELAHRTSAALTQDEAGVTGFQFRERGFELPPTGLINSRVDSDHKNRCGMRRVRARARARARAGGGGGAGGGAERCPLEEEWPREGERVVAGWGDPLCFSQGRGPPSCPQSASSRRIASAMYVIRKECLLESCIVKGEIEAEVHESL